MKGVELGTVASNCVRIVLPKSVATIVALIRMISTLSCREELMVTTRFLGHLELYNHTRNNYDIVVIKKNTQNCNFKVISTFTFLLNLSNAHIEKKHL